MVEELCIKDAVEKVFLGNIFMFGFKSLQICHSNSQKPHQSPVTLAAICTALTTKPPQPGQMASLLARPQTMVAYQMMYADPHSISSGVNKQTVAFLLKNLYFETNKNVQAPSTVIPKNNGVRLSVEPSILPVSLAASTPFHLIRSQDLSYRSSLTATYGQQSVLLSCERERSSPFVNRKSFLCTWKPVKLEGMRVVEASIEPSLTCLNTSRGLPLQASNNKTDTPHMGELNVADFEDGFTNLDDTVDPFQDTWVSPGIKLVSNYRTEVDLNEWYGKDFNNATENKQLEETQVHEIQIDERNNGPKPSPFARLESAKSEMDLEEDGKYCEDVSQISEMSSDDSYLLLANYKPGESQTISQAHYLNHRVQSDPPFAEGLDTFLEVTAQRDGQSLSQTGGTTSPTKPSNKRVVHNTDGSTSLTKPSNETMLQIKCTKLTEDIPLVQITKSPKCANENLQAEGPRTTPSPHRHSRIVVNNTEELDECLQKKIVSTQFEDNDTNAKIFSVHSFVMEEERCDSQPQSEELLTMPFSEDLDAFLADMTFSQELHMAEDNKRRSTVPAEDSLAVRETHQVSKGSNEHLSVHEIVLHESDLNHSIKDASRHALSTVEERVHDKASCEIKHEGYQEIILEDIDFSQSLDMQEFGEAVLKGNDKTTSPIVDVVFAERNSISKHSHSDSLCKSEDVTHDKEAGHSEGDSGVRQGSKGYPWRQDVGEPLEGLGDGGGEEMGQLLQTDVSMPAFLTTKCVQGTSIQLLSPAYQQDRGDNETKQDTSTNKGTKVICDKVIQSLQPRECVQSERGSLLESFNERNNSAISEASAELFSSPSCLFSDEKSSLAISPSLDMSASNEHRYIRSSDQSVGSKLNVRVGVLGEKNSNDKVNDKTIEVDIVGTLPPQQRRNLGSVGQTTTFVDLIHDAEKIEMFETQTSLFGTQADMFESSVSFLDSPGSVQESPSVNNGRGKDGQTKQRGKNVTFAARLNSTSNISVIDQRMKETPLSWRRTRRRPCLKSGARFIPSQVSPLSADDSDPGIRSELCDFSPSPEVPQHGRYEVVARTTFQSTPVAKKTIRMVRMSKNTTSNPYLLKLKENFRKKYQQLGPTMKCTEDRVGFSEYEENKENSAPNSASIDLFSDYSPSINGSDTDNSQILILPSQGQSFRKVSCKKTKIVNIHLQSDNAKISGPTPRMDLADRHSGDCDQRERSFGESGDMFSDVSWDENSSIVDVCKKLF